MKSRKKYMLDKPSTFCYRNIVFCSQHFEKSMFLDYKMDILASQAIPTLSNVVLSNVNAGPSSGEVKKKIERSPSDAYVKKEPTDSGLGATFREARKGLFLDPKQIQPYVEMRRRPK